MLIEFSNHALDRIEERVEDKNLSVPFDLISKFGLLCKLESEFNIKSNGFTFACKRVRRKIIIKTVYKTPKTQACLFDNSW